MLYLEDLTVENRSPQHIPRVSSVDITRSNQVEKEIDISRSNELEKELVQAREEIRSLNSHASELRS